jgi:predicted HTH domain antitoxin
VIPRLLTVVVLAAALGGCAYSHLQVSIDLYDEDPRFTPPLSPEDAVKLQENIENLRQAALDRTSERKFLATASRDIFIDTWKRAQGSEGVANQVDSDYRGYIASVDLAFQALEPKLDTAAGEVTSYLTHYQKAYKDAAASFKACETYRVTSRNTDSINNSPPDDCHVSELTKKVERLDQEWVLRRLPVTLRTEEATVRFKIAQAVSAYHSFSSPTATVQTSAPLVPASTDERNQWPKRERGTAADSSAPVRATGAFVIDWVQLRAKLNLMIEAAQLGGMRDRYAKLSLAIQSFNAGMASLAATSKLISRDEIARELTRSSTQSPSSLLDSSIKIALELDSLRTNLPDNASAQTALAGLARNSTQFAEVIDRLQDTGNPVWRIVTDPSNEEHWNKSPANTDFYAEGKSSVVLVRNDPMRFDVHDATNNPTALIKGQLEISRAVANAAISVASASTGIPAPQPPAAGAKTSDTSTTASAGNDAATAFATRKATADEAANLRDRQIRGLDLELSATLAALSAGPDKVPANQKSRLDALLNAYKTMFDASSKPSQ